MKRVYDFLKKAETCAFSSGEWIRITCELIDDDRTEAKKAMLDSYPNLRNCIMKTTATLRCSI